MSARGMLLVTALLWMPLTGPAAASADPAVRDESYVDSDGRRVLQQSIDVPAGVAAVWAACTTSEGFRSWAAPVAAIELRLGGMLETSYDARAGIGAPGNIRSEIVAYVPQRMIAMRNRQAPPGTPFDAGTFQTLHTVLLLQALDEGSTRVTVVQPGYGSGELYDGVYRHFAWGNGWTLERLRERFVNGPVDWGKLSARRVERSQAPGAASPR
jgi:uncharacterized protein YndB with AHSA1/START domain